MRSQATAVLGMLAGAPLIAAAGARAEFTGLTIDEQVVSIVDDPVVGSLDLTVFTLIANFDTVGDQLVAVAGEPGNPLNITVTGGAFWNHPLNGFIAPEPGIADFSPVVLHDSFVDIGQQTNSDAGPITAPVGNFPDGLESGDDHLSVLGGAQDTNSNGIPDGEETLWAREPFDPLGDPFDPGTYPGDGQVLIGRFSVAATGDVFISGGFMLLVNDGNEIVVSFTTGGCPWRWCEDSSRGSGTCGSSSRSESGIPGRTWLRS